MFGKLFQVVFQKSPVPYFPGLWNNKFITPEDNTYSEESYCKDMKFVFDLRERKARIRLLRHLRILLFIAGEPQKLDR